MAGNTPPQMPDPNTQLLGILAGALTILAGIVARFPRFNNKRKGDTDEHIAIKAIVTKDATIADLQRQLAIRTDERDKHKRDVDYLRPFENEVLTLRSVIDLKDKRIAELEGLLKMKSGGEKTKPITPPLSDEH